MKIKVFIDAEIGYTTYPCKQVIGGVFDWRSFVVVGECLSAPPDGFPCPLYIVVDELSGHPVGKGGTVQEAVAQARYVLTVCDKPALAKLFSEHRGRGEAFQREQLRRLKQAADEESARREAERQQRLTRSIPRARMKVFNASHGKCHYCATELDLRGNWHLEHKTPRSRGGTDLPDNLVASCAPCNMKKGRRTHEEFQVETTLKAVKT